MKRFDIKNLCLGIIVGAAAVLGVAAAANDVTTAADYRVVYGSVFDGNFQRNLTKAAEEGWKLEESDTFTDRHAYAVMSKAKK